MKIVSVFLKSVAIQFFKDHTGFFSVVLFVAVGLFRAQEHISIAELAISSLPVLSVILLLWVVYVIRVVFYVKAQLNKPTNRFLIVSEELPLSKQILTWILVQITVCSPVIFYAGFICSIAITTNDWTSFTYIVAFILICSTLPTLYYVHLIKQFRTEKQTGNILHWLDIRFVKPYPLWFIQYMLKSQPLTFILSKAFALVVLSIFIMFSNSGDYDWRVIAVGVVFGLVGNITIVDAYHRFENEQLELFRNFPIKTAQRFKNWVITFSLLAIPEIVVLVRHFSFALEIDKLVGLILLLLAFPLAVMAYQHMDNIDKEELIKAGASFAMLFFFLTMFSVHPLILSLLCLALTIGIIFRYYRYISPR